MSLLPGLEAELLGAAERTHPAAPAAAMGSSRTDGRPRRLRGHGRMGLFGVIGLLVFSGGAYAARGLWQPVLGTPETGRPTATSDAPPRRQLELLGVLRRPQTDADRGADTLAALKTFRPREGSIRLEWIRRVATLPNGSVAVLIPVDQKRPHDTAYAKRDDAQLCLAIVPTRGELQPPTCGPTSQVLVGEGLTVQAAEPLTAQQERSRAAAIRKAQREGRLPVVTDPKARGIPVSRAVSAEIYDATYGSKPRPDSFQVSVVPDVVKAVSFFREPGKPVVRVTGNVVVRRVAPDGWSETTWLDADGRALNADGVRVAPSPLVP